MRHRPGETAGRTGPVAVSAGHPRPRFLTLDQVGEELNISRAQVYALVRTGALPAIKVGGRGQWRVERAVLEEHPAALCRRTANGGNPGARPDW